MPLVAFKNDNYVNTECSNRRENILGNVWFKRFQLNIPLWHSVVIRNVTETFAIRKSNKFVIIFCLTNL